MHCAAVTAMFAGMIENRWRVAQSTEHLVIRFQVAADLLDSSLVALAGIDRDGRLARQRLAAGPSTGAATVLLPNGPQVWGRVEMRAPDGRHGLVAVSPPAASCAVDPRPRPEPPAITSRLRESDLDIIRKALQACCGNVSDAARRLGVSRGLIYRRLREPGVPS